MPRGWPVSVGGAIRAARQPTRAPEAGRVGQEESEAYAGPRPQGGRVPKRDVEHGGPSGILEDPPRHSTDDARDGNAEGRRYRAEWPARNEPDQKVE
jgi:hypothetical protein